MRTVAFWAIAAACVLLVLSNHGKDRQLQLAREQMQESIRLVQEARQQCFLRWHGEFYGRAK